MSEKDFEADLVELEDDEGGKVTLRVERYFFYNGDEYVLLTDDLDGSAEEETVRELLEISYRLTSGRRKERGGN